MTREHEITDIELIYMYRTGWNEGLYGMDNSHLLHDPLFRRAYNIGSLDAWAGDDVSSIDRKSNEDIVKQIRSPQAPKGGSIDRKQ